jgi:hypothetical protein
MSRAKQIEKCPHVKRGTKIVVWFLTTGTVILCKKCSRGAVRTVRTIARGAR